MKRTWTKDDFLELDTLLVRYRELRKVKFPGVMDHAEFEQVACMILDGERFADLITTAREVTVLRERVMELETELGTHIR